MIDRKRGLRLALPKGRLLAATAGLLSCIGLEFKDYNGATRVYSYESAAMPGLFAKTFQEKDIPVQVAIGNYDLGICGADWVEELTAKYPQSAVVTLKTLGYSCGTLYAAASEGCSIEAIKSSVSNLRTASDYPNMAELLARRLRLRQPPNLQSRARFGLSSNVTRTGGLI